MDTKEISLSAILAALYATLVIVLGIVSSGPVQLRVADCLIPLAAILGWPAVLGVTLGALVSNTFVYLGTVDIIFGATANLIAATIIFKLRKNLIIGCAAGSIAVGVIVGGYLWIYFPPPDIVGLNLPVWLAMMVSITLSSLIAISAIGYLLVKALDASGLAESLESMGLRTYLH
jgi:uncharacterized membrane protein